MIIFTTAYSEYAVEGFKLDAIDYLLKPFSFADFSRWQPRRSRCTNCWPIGRHKETLLPRKPLHATGSTSRSKPTTKRHWYASATSFIWKAKANTYGSIWTTDRPSRLFSGSRTWAALPSEMFMRVHRSYIVNLQRIRSYVKGRVFVSDSEYIPIGENYRETFQRYIETHYQNL